jgi:hypothetical protein
MKLIFCLKCKDVLKLHVGIRRDCLCGKSWGMYLENGLDADIGGRAIPLGFANSSFVAALKARPATGDGSRFEAFVIPEKCDTVHKRRKKK